MQQIINNLAAHDGVYAAVLTFDGEAPIYASPDSGVKFLPMATSALSLLDHVTEPWARVNADGATIQVHKFSGGRIAVAVMTGHPVVKSLKRLVRMVQRKTEASRRSHDHG